jgi:hypothetical protein
VKLVAKGDCQIWQENVQVSSAQRIFWLPQQSDSKLLAVWVIENVEMHGMGRKASNISHFGKVGISFSVYFNQSQG